MAVQSDLTDQDHQRNQRPPIQRRTIARIAPGGCQAAGLSIRARYSSMAAPSSVGLNPNGPSPPAYTTRPFNPTRYSRVGAAAYALFTPSSISSTQVRMPYCRAASHYPATVRRSSIVCGSYTSVAAFDPDSLSNNPGIPPPSHHPSTGCASRIC